ncbi:hypothetical protein HOY82DRAFT_478216 [Tuber indicum]|nr:hypothetical protein HOY82DRAFT_478216 [Tuber indicum]
MAAEIIHCPESSTARAFVHTDALSRFSSLAMKQPLANRLADWMSDDDAPWREQPPVKRIQLVLYSVHKFEVHFTEQTKPINNILAVIARLALRNGYTTISQITSASYGQSHGGRGSHSARRNSGGAGQNTSGSAVPSGARDGGGGPSKRPMKREGGGDGEGNPNKKKKLLNEPQGSGGHRCVVFELNQQSPERNGDHPCKDKQFITLESAIDHHLRIHVGHIQCPTCLIRKGTNTDMGKHMRTASCAPPVKIRDEVAAHGEDVRKVKSWDDLRRQVAPNGKIQYDMASNIDNLARSNLDEEKNQLGQLMAPFIPYQMNSPDIPELENNPIDRTPQQAFDIWPTWTLGGIDHDLSTLIPNTVDPQRLLISNPDSGYSPTTKRDIEIHRHECSEVRNQTSTGGGGGVTSGNEAPQQDPSLKLLDRVNGVIEAFLECDKDSTRRSFAQLCAKNLAIQMPENILQVFAQAYQRKVGPEKEAWAYDPPRGAKGKEGEHQGDVDQG